MPLDQKMRAIEARKKHDEAKHMRSCWKKSLQNCKCCKGLVILPIKGVLQCRKVSRNSSRDPCSRCKALCLEQALKRILPLGAWQETAERWLCHFNLLRNVQLFQVPNIHEISQIRKSKPLKSFHTYFSSYPTTAFPCLESYSWGPDMVSSQMLETQGTASEFLAQLGMSNSKQKSDHPRTPVTRIHHFNTGVVFWFEFYISDLKSLLIDYLLILMDHVEYPSFAMFVRCGFKLSVLRRMAWQKWNSSSRRCPKAKQRPFSCGHGTRGWPMGRLDEGMKACTFNVIWICNV